MSSGPTDEQLLRLLPGASKVERAPYEYATSFPLEHVVAHFEDGDTRELILKDASWGRLLPDARASKPSLLYKAEREIDTYRKVLPVVGAGPEWFGGRGTWFLIEKVPGVELWQIGDIEVWKSVAVWLARFHERGVAVDALSLNPHLLEYTSDYFRRWPLHATAATNDAAIRHIAQRYDQVVERLCRVPSSFIHGEFYPSNVLVANDTSALVWPVDWEMAGVGPPVLDLVALTSGWDPGSQHEMTHVYVAASSATWVHDGLEYLLDCARLHYAMQWLGWSPGWTPPDEHSKDWLQEAVNAADRLGL